MAVTMKVSAGMWPHVMRFKITTIPQTLLPPSWVSSSAITMETASSNEIFITSQKTKYYIWEGNVNGEENSVVWVRERTTSSDRRLSAKLVSTFADRGCRVVSATDHYGRNLRFLDRSRYFFFEVAPQLCSRGWVDPVPDPLLLRNSGIAANRTRTSGSVARNSDH
jgi:hypothetical protein